MNYKYNAENYKNISIQNMNYINNINENNNINHKDNFIINNKLYSNSMIEPKINQNILDPYPNNLNYKYKNNTPFNTNSNQDEYKYSPNNNDINNNDKNISLASQISQEIDRQKLKFDEMIEKAKNINNSEIYEFDIKKYLPKDNYENSKALRKYKDLIKPNIYSKKNNYIGNRNKDIDFKYNDIKDNSLSEIPIRNDNLFEDELSNFNLENKEINIMNNYEENEQINMNLMNQEQLKKNLMNNLDNHNLNDIKMNIENNQNNLEDNKYIVDNNENININKLNKANEIKKPYYLVFYERMNLDEEDNSNEESDEEQLDEIEGQNKEFNKKNKELNNINNFCWHCLDFIEEKPDKNFNEFFNNDNI